MARRTLFVLAIAMQVLLFGQLCLAQGSSTAGVPNTPNENPTFTVAPTTSTASLVPGSTSSIVTAATPPSSLSGPALSSYLASLSTNSAQGAGSTTTGAAQSGISLGPPGGYDSVASSLSQQSQSQSQSQQSGPAASAGSPDAAAASYNVRTPAGATCFAVAAFSCLIGAFLVLA